MLNNYALLEYLNQILTPEKFKDYCPNGLQVEGSSEIKRIITGVSLSDKLIEAAINENAQAIFVHHGIFWLKDDYSLTGVKKRRVEKLLKHNINLYAYHLPLDNHPSLGNNIQLAQSLDIEVKGSTGEQNLLWYGQFAKPVSLGALVQRVKYNLQHEPIYFSDNEEKLVSTVAWCTGGGDGFFSDAIKLGVDAYISGEASEPTMALALESSVAYIAAGHYATERGGVQAVGKHLHKKFTLPVQFIELYNPI